MSRNFSILPACLPTPIAFSRAKTLLISSFLTVGAQYSLAEANVWLPGRYKEHLPQLEKAVQQVAEGEQCQTVVRGELLESKSVVGKPVFRIICRDDSLQTYPVFIDGLSLQELHASGETRLEQKQRHLPFYARVCLKELKQKARDMRKPRFPEGAVLEPSLINGERVEFEVDFSSKSLNGTDLAYRGYCVFESMASYETEIRPRPKNTAPMEE